MFNNLSKYVFGFFFYNNGFLIIIEHLLNTVKYQLLACLLFFYIPLIHDYLSIRDVTFDIWKARLLICI